MAVLGFLPVPTTYFNINQNLLIHNLTRHSPAPATPFTIKRRDFDSLFSLRQGRGRGACFPLACLPPSPHSLSTCQPKTRLFGFLSGPLKIVCEMLSKVLVSLWKLIW
ncbi:hypothetical protein CISIN_1g030819mg [Citrus sinensis]|uniref:Uncharacterized protein n=1 Tax=Citrus sinensis TaxID=2711 RepID=A0A067DMJ3_CITSI|nr:hypothetical protein CISIN_1g030819mg [Citrus sinensis]KDO44088.1 hypothetical protein CISIN_1g030819mg [Citrus sinensis]